MTKKTNLWLRGLVAAIVTGASTSALSALGIAGADAAGASVGQLNVKQIGVLTVTGALVGLAAYLKQSPVPPAA